jgi:hypothetical protein
VRLKAIFLATVFLGGNFGLPDFDALRYHWARSETTQQQAHFDPPGGCSSHAEACVLDAVPLGPCLGDSIDGGAAADRVDGPPPPIALISTPRSINPHAFPPSRAPPALV